MAVSTQAGLFTHYQIQDKKGKQFSEVFKILHHKFVQKFFDYSSMQTV